MATERYPGVKSQHQTQRLDGKILSKARMNRVDRNSRMERDHNDGDINDDKSFRSVTPGATINRRQRSLQPPPNNNQNTIDMFVDDNLFMP